MGGAKGSSDAFVVLKALSRVVETMNNDTLVTSGAKDGRGTRKSRHFDNFERASRGNKNDE